MSRWVIIILTIVCLLLSVALVGVIFMRVHPSGTPSVVLPIGASEATTRSDHKPEETPATPSQNRGLSFTASQLTVNKQPSVGAQAGQAVKVLNKTAQDVYANMSRQADQSAKDLSVITEEMLKTFNEQFEKASKELQPSLESLKASIVREIEEFQETLNTPDRNQKV